MKLGQDISQVMDGLGAWANSKEHSELQYGINLQEVYYSFIMTHKALRKKYEHLDEPMYKKANECEISRYLAELFLTLNIPL